MNSDFFKVACPHCGGHIEFGQEYEGQTMDCPHCAQPVLLQSSIPNPGRRYNRSTGPRESQAQRTDYLRIGVIVFVSLLLFGTAVAVLQRVVGAEGLLALAGTLGVLTLAVLIYLIPTIIAHRRQHRNATAIFLLNLLLGWTLLGWVGALVWSVYEDRR